MPPASASSWWGIMGAGSDDRVAQQFLQVWFCDELIRYLSLIQVRSEPCSILMAAFGASPFSSGGLGKYKAHGMSVACSLLTEKKLSENIFYKVVLCK